MDTIKKLQGTLKTETTKLDQLALSKKELKQEKATLERDILNKERILGKKLPASDPLRKKLKTTLGKEKTVNKSIRDQQIIKDKTHVAIGKLLTTPQMQVVNLKDQFPVMLMPVKVHTRFMQVKHVTKQATLQDIIDLKELKPKVGNSIKPQLDTSGLPRIPGTAPAPKPSGIGRSRPGLPFMPSILITPKALANIERPAILPKEKPKTGFLKIPDKKELWLRIYPDDIFAQTHEEQLSTDEYTTATIFWNEIFAANDLDKSLQKEHKIGAWKVLVQNFGTARAAWIVKTTRPSDVAIKENQPFLTRKPQLPDLILKEDSWTEPPSTEVLPNRFVIRLYKNKTTFREVTAAPIPATLILGLDPESDDEKAFELKNGEREVPDNIKWLTDFQEAEKVGMAIRIPLAGREITSGFHKIVVLGVKTSTDAKAGKNLVEKLLYNHQYKVNGMELLKNGTPTNNTDEDSGFSVKDTDPTKSFANILGDPLFVPTNTHQQKSDGQRLAEALGISKDVLTHVNNAGHSDITEALAINDVLYPATIGYSLSQFYSNLLTKVDQNRVRHFYENYVIGRGHLPSIRIDNQPYGILPTTAFSKFSYPKKAAGTEIFYQKMYTKVLLPLSRYWENLVQKVNYITDPSHRTAALNDVFLNILGLHASSVEYHQRFVGGVNLINSLSSFAEIFQNNLITYGKYNALVGGDAPKILGYGMAKEVKQLLGQVIDGTKPSESRSIRPLLGSAKNYLDFISDSNLTQIRLEDLKKYTNTEQSAPNALLYLMVRHAFLREGLNTGFQILAQANLLGKLDVIDFEVDDIKTKNNLSLEHQVMLKEMITIDKMPAIKRLADIRMNQTIPNKNKIKERERFLTNFMTKESVKLDATIQKEITKQNETFQIKADKFEALNEVYPTVTGQLKLNDFINDRILKKHPTTATWRKMKSSLDTLKQLPTARLERLFNEHLDTAHYRLDSWMQGVVQERLGKLRKKDKEGLYLGAYSILEDVKPNGKNGIHVTEIKNAKKIPLVGSSSKNAINPIVDTRAHGTKKALTKHLKDSFVYLGTDRNTNIVFDPITKKYSVPPSVNTAVSRGFVHAPSIGQAVTAAVLKGGYDAHRLTGSPDETLAVNLTSKRVRRAMFFLQGIKNGQELGALLGYHFERNLRENSPATHPLDQYFLELRTLYPFNAGKVHDISASSPIEAAEAYHVVDGLSLLKEFQKAKKKLPSKIINKLRIASKNDVKSLLLNALKDLDIIVDSINDLLIAESVFQMVSGSPDASSAVLKVMNESGELNQMPEVVNIPRSGQSMAHKIGVHLAPGGSTKVWAKGSPLSTVSPEINAWVANQLPDPSNIGVRVSVKNKPTKTVFMHQLGIEAYDFVKAMSGEETNFQESEIASRVKCHLYAKDASIEPDDILEIIFKSDGYKIANKISLFEVMPLVRKILAILDNLRPLVPEDLITPSELDAVTQTNGTYDNKAILKAVKKLTDQTVTDSTNAIIVAIEARLPALLLLDNDDEITINDQEQYQKLCEAMLRARLYDVSSGVAKIDAPLNLINRDVIVAQAENVVKLLRKKQNRASTIMASLDSDEKTAFQQLQEVVAIFFGRSIKILPQFTLDNATQYGNAVAQTVTLDADEDMVEDWLAGVAMVKPHVKDFQMLQVLKDILDVQKDDEDPLPVQLPFLPEKNTWLGAKLPDGDLPLDPLSLVFKYPKSYNSSNLQLGFVIEEWNELIPFTDIDTGMALHYNRPNQEAPNCILLAVSPDETGAWTWEHLMGCVTETLDMAKKRAVEPDLLKQDRLLFKMLPGLVAAINAKGKTPSLDFGRNNFLSIYAFLTPFIIGTYLKLDTDG